MTTAVVPGPPALVAELMGSAAAELDDLREAAESAVHEVLSALITMSARSPASPRVQLVVVGAGTAGEFDAAGPVSFTSFGRDVHVPALIDGRDGDRDLPTPIMVARYLASRDLAAHPEHAPLWASARWVTTCRGDAHALGRRLGAEDARIGLILVADGAACHGPKAPRAEDPRATAYDDAVCAALASGQPGRLSEIDHRLGEDLGASGAAVWPVLAAAAGSEPAVTRGTENTAGSNDAAASNEASSSNDAAASKQIAEVLWTGAPYGVGWTVASWRRPCP